MDEAAIALVTAAAEAAVERWIAGCAEVQGDPRLGLFPLQRPLVAVSVAYDDDTDIGSLLLDFGDGLLIEVGAERKRKRARLNIARVTTGPTVKLADAMVREGPATGWRGRVEWEVDRVADSSPLDKYLAEAEEAKQ